MSKLITQEELAKKVGVSRQTISSIENQDYQPSILLALKIAKILDVDIHQMYILEDSDF